MTPCYSLAPTQIVNSWRDAKLARNKLGTDVIVKHLESEWTNGINPLHLHVTMKTKTINSEFRP